MSNDTQDPPIFHVSFKHGRIRETILDDAQRADEYPEDDVHHVKIEPGEITVEGTPEGIRWLYDYLEWAEDAWLLDREQYYADECRAMADIIWEAVDGDLPSPTR